MKAFLLGFVFAVAGAIAAPLPLGTLYYDPEFGIGQPTVLLQNFAGSCDPNGIQICGFVASPEEFPTVSGLLTINTTVGAILIPVPSLLAFASLETEVDPQTFLSASFTGLILEQAPYLVATPNGTINATAYAIASNTISAQSPNGLIFVNLPSGPEIPEPSTLLLTGAALLLAAGVTRAVSRSQS